MMSVTEPVRRFEVFTGAGQRRRWSDEEKARIVAESFGGLESVCNVARRHGLAPTQLFAWRKDARSRAIERAPTFVPVVVEPDRGPAAPKVKRTRRSSPGTMLLTSNRASRRRSPSPERL